MTLHEYFGDWLHYIDQKELENVMAFLRKQDSFYPAHKDVFRAFRLCSARSTVAVFLGQDPYPQKGMATGILFGNPASIPDEKISPSLKVIRDSVMEYDMPHPERTFDVTLESWANQGLLMLNTALSVSPGKPGSHSLQWRLFMHKLLSSFSLYNTGMTYVLFGKQAQSFKASISPLSGDIFEVSHPANVARNAECYPSNLFHDIHKSIMDKTGQDMQWFNEIKID